MELDFLDGRPAERDLAGRGVAGLFLDGAVHLAAFGVWVVHGGVDAADDVTDEHAEGAHEGFVVSIGDR